MLKNKLLYWNGLPTRFSGPFPRGCIAELEKGGIKQVHEREKAFVTVTADGIINVRFCGNGSSIILSEGRM